MFFNRIATDAPDIQQSDLKDAVRGHVVRIRCRSDDTASTLSNYSPANIKSRRVRRDLSDR